MATVFASHTRMVVGAYVQEITEADFERFHADCSAMPGVHVATVLIDGMEGDQVKVLAVSYKAIDEAARQRVAAECVRQLVKWGRLEMTKQDGRGHIH